MFCKVVIMLYKGSVFCLYNANANFLFCNIFMLIHLIVLFATLYEILAYDYGEKIGTPTYRKECLFLYSNYLILLSEDEDCKSC